MNAPRIEDVHVVEEGVVVTYEDHTQAFYHQSVLHAHLRPNALALPPKKQPRSVTLPRPAKAAASEGTLS